MNKNLCWTLKVAYGYTRHFCGADLIPKQNQRGGADDRYNKDEPIHCKVNFNWINLEAILYEYALEETQMI